ncbi:MAG: hypothetical protein JNK74_26600 [Candidatus Hydrogenedentes bacterium]|nr:hypothetical protein [Candidatus Hydrogenedentota bacterium]
MSPLEPRFSTLPPEGPAPELDRSPGQKRTTARLWIAVAAGLCLIGLLALILIPNVNGLKDESSRSSTKNNMTVLGQVFKMYASQSRANQWPHLSPDEHIWTPDLSVLCPEFLQNSSVLVAREHPDADHIRETMRAVLEGPNPDFVTAEGLMALSFAYFGYAVNNETDFSVLVHAKTGGLIDNPHEILHVSGSGKWLPPLNTDSMRCFGSNSQHPEFPPGINPTNPVLVEVWAWKIKGKSDKFDGAHVLYMDGHVEFVPLGTFPVVPSVMDGLCGTM